VTLRKTLNFLKSNIFMRRLVWVGIFLCVSVMIYAQPKTVNGIVKDDKGAAVPYAVIQIKGTTRGVNSDSLGVFSINVKSNTVLLVNAMGYATATINVKELANDNAKDLNNVTVILKAATNALTDVTVGKEQTPSGDEYTFKKMATNMLQDFNFSNSVAAFSSNTAGTALNAPNQSLIGGGGVNMYTGAALPVFSQKEDTKGGKYLFDQWVKGTATNSYNAVVSNDTYLYNYDKITKSLLVTSDKRSMIEISKTDLNGFTFIDKNNKEIVFEKVVAIDPNTFMIQLLKDSTGYSLYKSLHTKFIRANYHSDGLTESGNNYDEYVDEYTYYILFPGGKQFSKVELKKKSIKEVLMKEEKKVKSFFSQHGSDDLDEFFLMALVASLNM